MKDAKRALELVSRAVRVCASILRGPAMTGKIDSYSYPPRGMSRGEAARYIGVGTTKFDEMVADRRMPKPKRIDGRTIWDRIALDAAFSDLPADGGNRIDELLNRARK